ncbi:MAG: YybS family protein [Acidobacteriota bacterium]|nr:YybS family protein [Acidobacteriota bacterium]
MTETSLPTETAAIPERTFGRSMRYVSGYAILIAVMLVSPLFVFLPAALFHCIIRNGRRIPWSALFIGTAVAGLLAVAGANAPQVTTAEANTGLAYLVALVLAVALPSMAVSSMVERAESFGRILLAAVLLSAVGLTATEISMRAVAGFSPFAEQVTEARADATKLVAALQTAGLPADVIAAMRRWSDIRVFCLPAFLLISIVIVFVLSLVLFGRLQSWRSLLERRQAAASASPYLFRNFSLPEWLLFAFVIGGLSPLASGMPQRVGANLLALVSFLYLLQGLAIFRSFLAAAGAGFTSIFLAYVFLGVLTITGISPLVLSIAGLFDSFFDFRKFNRKDHSDESHSD